MGKGKKVGKALLTIGGFFLGAGHVGQAFFGASSAVAGLYGAALASTLWSTFNPTKTDTIQDYSRFDSMMNTPSSDAMIPIIYGTRKWAGNQTWHQASSDFRVLTKDVVLCEGEIKGLSEVKANDLVISTVLLISVKNTIYPNAAVSIRKRAIGSQIVANIVYGESNIIISADNIQNLCDKINAHDGWVATTKSPASLLRAIEKFDLVNCYNNPKTSYASSLPGCSYSFHNGESTQSPPSNYDVVGGYKNCAWIRSTLTPSEKLNGQNPTITSIVQGTKVLIWNGSTWTRMYSENPAYCLLDFITNKRYGLGRWITWDMVDLDSFRESAAYCDELVTTKVPTTLSTYDDVISKITELQALTRLSESAQNNVNKEIIRLQQSLINIQSKPVEYTLETTPRYTLNMIIDQKKDAMEHLADILSNFAGFLVYTNNRVALRIERATPVSYSFNDSNIVKDSVSFQGIPSENRPNKYIIGFFDPENNWTQVKVLVEDTVDQKQRGKVIKKELTLSGCTSQSQVLRLGNMYRDISKLCTNIITFSTTTFAMHLEPGDVVTVTQTAWINNEEQVFLDKIPVRILEIRKKQGIWEIKAQQYNESIYNDALGAEINVKNYVPIDNPLSDTVPDVSNLELSQRYYIASDGTVVSDILGQFTLPNYLFLKNIYIKYSVDNGVSWVDYGVIVDDSFVIHNAKSLSTYLIKIVVENTVGRRSTGFVSDPIFVTGKDEPPSDVSQMTIAQTGTNLQVVIVPIPDPDLKKYELRLGSTWGSSVLVQQFIGSSLLIQAPSNGTMTYWVKAIDNSDNYSERATKAIVNVVGLPARNIIYTETLEQDTWIVSNMWRDLQGRYRISSRKTLGDYEFFADIFGGLPLLRHDAEILLPVIDLGPTVLDESCYWTDSNGNMRLKTTQTLADFAKFSDIFGAKLTYVEPSYVTETLFDVDVTYNVSGAAYIDIEYRTSLNGDTWSDWMPSMARQFMGRYLQVRLLPRSSDGYGQVYITAATVSIDVPDITEIIENVNVPAEVTRIFYKKKFTQVKTIDPYTRSTEGVLMTNQITNKTSEYFDLAILGSDGLPTSGVLEKATIRGY